MVKVSVTVPCYNLANSVGRTIKSVLSQTLTNIELVVVNDGSTDNSEEVILRAIEGDSRARYIYQENAGVAHARNAGVRVSSGKYVMCLDSDDAIEPRYLEHLSNALDENPDISIVFTALYFIKPDGQEGISPWPNGFDPDRQLSGANQIPTAAMMRRRVWERLGGQRQRYAPLGAGAEDGEFWYRATVYGFNALYINPIPDSMFLYSWQSGRVSGNKDYHEVDYRAWHPWSKDKRYPLPALAKPQHFSHPARWYDDPHVSVIIPVGPGHAKFLVDALDSLDAQTHRQWEAVVVFDVPRNEWAELKENGTLKFIETTWPFARFATTEGGVEVRSVITKLDAEMSGMPMLHFLESNNHGASRARNIGLHLARAPLVTFLDADDWLVPAALEMMLSEFVSSGKAVYCDHYGIAHVKTEDLGLVVGDVIEHNPKTLNTLIVQRAADFDCERAMQQPKMDGRIPYIWGSIVTLLPKRWILEVGGFDESLRSWEDVILFWKLAWSGKCFFRIPEPLFVYRYVSGIRREEGLASANELLRYAKKLADAAEKTMCNCKDNKPPISIRLSGGSQSFQSGGNMTAVSLSRGGSINVADEDMVLCLFQPINDGDIPRYGQHDFGGSNFIFYGHRSSGQKFLVHKLDIEATNTVARARGFPDVFIPVTQASEAISKQVEDKPVPPPPPVEILANIVDFSGSVAVLTTATQVVGAKEKEDVDPLDIPVLDLNIGPMGPSLPRILREAGIVTARDLVQYDEEYAEFGGLTNLRGIGKATRNRFMAAIKLVEASTEDSPIGE